jgi:hypothetical protein
VVKARHQVRPAPEMVKCKFRNWKKIWIEKHCMNVNKKKYLTCSD